MKINLLAIVLGLITMSTFAQKNELKAAEKAHREVWSKTTPAERGKYIFRIARLMQEQAKELAAKVTKR